MERVPVCSPQHVQQRKCPLDQGPTVKEEEVGLIANRKGMVAAMVMVQGEMEGETVVIDGGEVEVVMGHRESEIMGDVVMGGGMIRICLTIDSEKEIVRENVVDGIGIDNVKVGVIANFVNDDAMNLTIYIVIGIVIVIGIGIAIVADSEDIARDREDINFLAVIWTLGNHDDRNGPSTQRHALDLHTVNINGTHHQQHEVQRNHQIRRERTAGKLKAM